MNTLTREATQTKIYLPLLLIKIYSKKKREGICPPGSKFFPFESRPLVRWPLFAEKQLGRQKNVSSSKNNGQSTLCVT